MAIYYKQGKGARTLVSYAGDSDIHDTVRESIGKVALEGDIGIRRLSEQFDNWSPVSFRLSEEEIFEIIESRACQTGHSVRTSAGSAVR